MLVLVSEPAVNSGTQANTIAAQGKNILLIENPLFKIVRFQDRTSASNLRPQGEDSIFGGD